MCISPNIPWLTGLVLAVGVSSALAQKPETPPGQAKRPAPPVAEAPATAGAAAAVGAFFGDAKQQAYRDYLRQSVQSGRCPPGLAKIFPAYPALG